MIFTQFAASLGGDSDQLFQLRYIKSLQYHVEDMVRECFQSNLSQSLVQYWSVDCTPYLKSLDKISQCSLHQKILKIYLATKLECLVDMISQQIADLST